MEKHKLRHIAVATGLVIGATACGSDEVEPVKDSVISVGNSEDFEVQVEYTPSGKRVTRLNPGTNSEESIQQFCDGGDLVEMADAYLEQGVERTQNHPACDDGRLEASDFEIQQKAE